MTQPIKTPWITAVIAIIASITTGCTNTRQTIEIMVDELNSAQFRAAEVQTGLFTDSRAALANDTLSITFFCRSHINLATIPPEKLPQLQVSATEECRNMLHNNNFKNGMEALHDNGMTLLFIWQDTRGNRVELPLDPSAVLTGEHTGNSLKPVFKPGTPDQSPEENSSTET